MSSAMQQAADHSFKSIIIDNRFLGKTNETHERYVFNTRKQKARETVDDYISALCTLASTCNFCDCLKDSLLRDRIVSGIKDSSTRKRLLQEADLNLETCIAMCRAAEFTSPSQPVKTVTWTEDNTAVQAGPVSSGNFSLNLRHCDPMASPDEVEMPEINFNTELDDSDDLPLQWTMDHQSSGIPCDRTENNVGPTITSSVTHPWNPSATVTTSEAHSPTDSGQGIKAEPVDDHCMIGGDRFDQFKPVAIRCQPYPASSSLPDNLLKSVKSEDCDSNITYKDPDMDVQPKSFKKSTSSVVIKVETVTDDAASSESISTRYTDMDRPAGDQQKQEPAWSMEEDSPDQPSAVYSTVQPMSDNTSGSLLSLNTSHSCYLCSAAFVLVSSLELHLASVHGERLHMVLPGSSTPDRRDAGNCNNTDIEEGVDVWDVCRMYFPTPSDLERHKLIHSGFRPFVCDVCSKSFLQASNLIKHKKIHTEERPYKCGHCGSDFKRSGSLQDHIKSVHEGARSHVCDACGAAFFDKGNLIKHRRIHSGEKPHVCSDCGKSFAQSGALAQHQLIHTGEKPHVCSYCGKGFARSSTLAKHLLTHTGEKPHVCSDCGKGFAQSGTLAKHCLTHTGDKLHSCPHCPAAFSQSWNLKRHIQRKHQEH